MQNYEVNQKPIGIILDWINSEELNVPEFQRPFVWKPSQVKDFIDSLYFRFPVGYFITWKGHNVRLKSGKNSNYDRILIDGQQRANALRAALLGEQIIDKNYKQTKIVIAFHPGQEKFQLSNPANQKDKKWISNISDLFSSEAKLNIIVKEYCSANPEINENDVYERLEKLKNIIHNDIGLIELSKELDIDTVTRIFLRINSTGVSLNEADFAMSKLAANEKYDGYMIRKAIDYFCYYSHTEEALSIIKKDTEFFNSEYYKSINWLKNKKDNLYYPSHTDVLRVALMTKFKRGKLRELNELLKGRNFNTKSYEESIAKNTFQCLSESIMLLMKKSKFNQFAIILQSAGFVDKSMIRSINALNFAYALYLNLHLQEMPKDQTEYLVRRWFVMSVLTTRYTGSFESTFNTDIRNINEQGPKQYLSEIESAELSEAFWKVRVPQLLTNTSPNDQIFNTFIASQIRDSNKSFLSKDISVQDLKRNNSQIHHVYPKSYLKSNCIDAKDYNQIANYVLIQSEINIEIGNKSPKDYFQVVLEQCENKLPKIGTITSDDDLNENLNTHCIPENIHEYDVKNYQEFLIERQKSMAAKIRNYYKSL